MAKLMTMFLILLALQAAIMLYHGTSQDNDLWNFIMNTDNWSSQNLIISLGAIALAIGLTGISSGSVFGFKTDFLIMAPAIGGLISIGVVFAQLANIIRDELISTVFTACINDPSAGACSSANFIVGILIGPFALYYVWTVIEWWRGKDY